MRVGLAYESSTWYNEWWIISKLVSVSSSSTGDDINDVSDPRLTNFTHRTSYKHQVNLQEVLPMFFGARGLISIDYAIKIIVKNSNLKATLITKAWTTLWLLL
jgi:hypothetical protein